MADTHSFDPYLEPWLTARVPRLADYSQQLADFRYWVYTEVDAQANYTDRYAPPALETYDRNGEVVNHIVLNRWYDEQHQELYRRGIIGLPYAEKAPHLLTFAMGYVLAQADISLHCPVTLTGAVAYVLSAHAPDAVRQRFLHDVVRMDGFAKTGGTWATEQHGGSDVGATTTVAIAMGDHYRAARFEVVHQQCQQRTWRWPRRVPRELRPARLDWVSTWCRAISRTEGRTTIASAS